VKVLFLQRQPCIRAMKYAIGLRARVPGVRLGFAYQGRTLTSWYGAGDELFERWWHLPASDPREALAAAVAEFRPDVIHSHNLPDVLTVLALDVADGRVPVIHDVHDMQSLRATPYEDGFDDPEDQDVLEREAVEGCAGLIAVSEEMREELAARYTLPTHTLLFANYALSRDIAQSIAPGQSDDGPLRVVYQGSLSANGSHYDLRDHFRAVGDAGLLLDVYPNRDAPAYRELAQTVPGMRLMRSLAPADLMRALPAYDVGWAAFNPLLNAAHMDTALPNKAFEYLASGLPIAAGPHGALRRLVREHGVGVAIDRAGELEARVEEKGLARLRERVRDRRRLFTVEGHIGALAELYAEVAAAAVPA
jgi:glycosyltransferase involved in cell wall biosynthesis